MADIDELIRLARQPDPAGAEAQRALGREGVAALPRLADAIRTAEPPEKVRLGQAFLRIPPAGAEEVLLSVLDDPDTELRTSAYTALGLTGAQAAVEPLAARLLDGNRDESEQAWAAGALGALGQTEGLAPLRLRLSQLEQADEIEYRATVTIALISALGMLGDHTHADLLRRLYEGSDLIKKLEAVKAMKGVVFPGILRLLNEILGNEMEEPEIRMDALEALYFVGLVESIEFLVNRAGDADEQIAARARLRLEMLAGRSFSDAAAATQWWAGNSAQFDAQNSCRFGKPILIAELIERIQEPGGIWLDIIAEIRLLTGQSFGLSSYTWLQEAERDEVRARIEAWWSENAARFEPGGLYKHGVLLDPTLVR